MTLCAFFLIFASVFLHVSWNLISKRVNPSPAFYSLMSLTGCILWLPFFVMSDVSFLHLGWKFLLIFAVSTAGELAYVNGLAGSYKRGDFSLVYPVIRALPVVMVAIITILFGIGKEFGPAAIAGMFIITAGCLLMPMTKFSDLKLSGCRRGAVFFILLGAAGTTAYTIGDSEALSIVRAGRDAAVVDTLAYLFLVEIFLGGGNFLLFAHKHSELENFKNLCRSPWPYLSGICCTVAYGLVLIAMKFVTNVSYVQAFRQMSLPLGFLAGMLILKERGSLPKYIGITLIAGGLILVSLR